MNFLRRSGGRSSHTLEISETFTPDRSRRGTPDPDSPAPTLYQHPGSIFGIDLQRSVALAHVRLQVKDPRGEMKTCEYVPIVLAKCALAIKEADTYEGLFRSQSWDSSTLDNIQVVFETAPKYGKHFKWNPSLGYNIPRLAKSLYVRYLSSLPDPVVPRECYPEFAQIHESSWNEGSQATSRRYAELLCRLPLSNMYVLLYTIDLLDIVARQASRGVPFIAETFAPTLFRPEGRLETETSVKILEYLINHRDLDATILELNHDVLDKPVFASLDNAIQAAIQPQLPTSEALGPPLSVPTPQQVSPGLESVPDITANIQKEGTNSLFRGGFCEIYKGNYQPSDGGAVERVALRLPFLKNKPEQTQRRFWREVEIWFDLRHSHINQLYGTFSDAQGFYMVSPWRDRGSVWDWMMAPNPLQPLPVLIGIAKALVYLHDNNCVHGDLKLENVLLSDDGEALLTDFGLTVKIGLSIATSIEAAGSIPWSAPEILMGGKKSKESDVYSFGMVIAQLLTRKTPFGDSPAIGNVIVRITKGERPLERDVVGMEATGSWRDLWHMATTCWGTECSTRPVITVILRSLNGMAMG